MLNFMFFVLSLSAVSIAFITSNFLITQKNKLCYKENKRPAKMSLILSLSFLSIMIPVQLGILYNEIGIFVISFSILSFFIYKLISIKIKHKNNIKETLRLIDCNEKFNTIVSEMDNIVAQIERNEKTNKKELKNLNKLLIEKRDSFLNIINQYKISL